MMSLQQIGIFVNLPFCQVGFLTTCNFVNFGHIPFYQLEISFCLLTVLSTFHFVNLPFCQFAILSSCGFLNPPFSQLAILSI
jgi:hypothetical protein